MSDKDSSILSEVERYYQDYGVRARELNEQGNKVIGYVCSFVPVEMITAAGCIPFRVRGNVGEPITTGDTLLETIVCPFYRSCFDLSVKGKYGFLDGMVVPHGCDSMVRSFSTWSNSLGLSYFRFLNMPSVIKESTIEFFNAELNSFRKGLSAFAGTEISNNDLAEAIRLHNENRDKAKALYELRRADPPLISGTALTKVITVGSSLPVSEANQLFDRVLEELANGEASPGRKAPRIMVDGACVDNIELVKIIEDLGANVVMDTLCNGGRDSLPRADEGGDPVEALASRYLEKINCPKNYRVNTSGTRDGDLEARFGDIGFYSKEYKVDGLILYVYKYCDPFGFEVPARKTYYDSLNLPHLYLEDEYSAGTIGQLKTRIQAFLEMIG